MKFSIISSILSVASIAAAADAAAASPSQACVPYDGVCFQNGMNYGACCGDGICAGSRCRDPKTEAGGMATTSAANNQGGGGAVVTQIGDGQIQVPTSAPVLPTPTPTIPIVNGAGKAMPGLAAAGVALAFLL